MEPQDPGHRAGLISRPKRDSFYLMRKVIQGIILLCIGFIALCFALLLFVNQGWRPALLLGVATAADFAFAIWLIGKGKADLDSAPQRPDACANRDPKWDRHVTMFRMVGSCFMLGGFFFVLEGISLALDPGSTVHVNHVETTSVAAKLTFAVGGLLCMIMGGLLALTPRRRLEQVFVLFAQDASHTP